MRDVLQQYATHLSRHEPVRDVSRPQSYAHWMCIQAIKMLEIADASSQGNPDLVCTARQWLGFIEGILWATGEFTIDEIRTVNEVYEFVDE